MSNEYEIGKFYTIRCARLENCSNGKVIFVATIGDPHRDPKLGVDVLHVHIDGRFAFSEAENFNIVGGRTNTVIDMNGDHFWLFKGFETRRKKCTGAVTGLNIDPIRYKLPKYWAWYSEFIGKSCKGKKCPHFGTEMLERDGVLVCPMHNLHADPKTERIIAPPGQEGCLEAVNEVSFSQFLAD